MDVMGVAFRRELFLVTQQVYPELQDKEKLSHTKIQQKLLRKLGDDAFPFFEMRHINCLTVLKIQDKSGSSPAPTGQIPAACSSSDLISWIGLSPGGALLI